MLVIVFTTPLTPDPAPLSRAACRWHWRFSSLTPLPLAEQRMQMQAGVVVVATFKNALMQKGFHLRIEADRLIQHRIAACGIGADADQIAVALVAGEQLLKLAHPRVVVASISAVMARLMDASISIAR